ncbi:MAG: serine--tRNA ligase [archaeon]|nr:serine--tRNA ligase [archaeon]
MIDLKFLKANPEIVKENIKKKFQDQKLPLVDEVIALDAENHQITLDLNKMRNQRNVLSKENSKIVGEMKKTEDPAVKADLEKKLEDNKNHVKSLGDDMAALEKKQEELSEAIKAKMMVIPNILDDDVPIGKDDSENVEITKYGEPVVPAYEVPYHADITEKFSGLDLDSARRVSGSGFYYLTGDIARLHSAILSYARDFMIGKGFTYCVPPFMIHSEVVNGVMSFAEMDAMMYKIEGEDLYLIGTSEHSMVGRFIGENIPEESLPLTLTSYSPCFRKEKGSHGIEERGVYRIHQFEKQEMVVICHPDERREWFNKMWNFTVEFFRTLDIPVRTLECCSGDLADLKVKSLDVEAWSPRQKKYFEVGSCSDLGDAQARRLKIRVAKKDGTKYYANTLNNTVVAPPRMLIAFLENNYQEDGTVLIPKALQPYLGGITRLVGKQ